MPSTSKKQHNFMAAIANSPSFAKKVGVPQSVGKDFNKADKGHKFSKGGDMATKMNPGFMAMIAKKKDGKSEGGKSDMKQDKSMMQKAVNKHEGRLHKGAAMTKLAKGGTSSTNEGSGGRGIVRTPGDAKLNSPGRYATKILPSSMKPLTQERSSSRDTSDDEYTTVNARKGGAIRKMAKGGGIETKGKTKGAMIKMKSGGRAC